MQYSTDSIRSRGYELRMCTCQTERGLLVIYGSQSSLKSEIYWNNSGLCHLRRLCDAAGMVALEREWQDVNVHRFLVAAKHSLPSIRHQRTSCPSYGSVVAVREIYSKHISLCSVCYVPPTQIKTGTSKTTRSLPCRRESSRASRIFVICKYLPTRFSHTTYAAAEAASLFLRNS